MADHVGFIARKLDDAPPGEIVLTEDLRSPLADLFRESKSIPGSITPISAYWHKPNLMVSATDSALPGSIVLVRLDLDARKITPEPFNSKRRWSSALLLVRHARHESDKEAALPGEHLHGAPRKLTVEGECETLDIAEYLATLAAPGADAPSVTIAALRYAPSWEAKATAGVIEHCLTIPGEPVRAQTQARSLASLDPGHLTSHYSRSADLDRLAVELASLATPPAAVLSEPDDDTYGFLTRDRTYVAVVVAHQPLLGWLAHRITGHPIPIQRSEAVCLTLHEPFGTTRPRGSLAWVLSPRDDSAMDDLKAKIRSKMDTAKVLGAFITAVFGFVLKEIADLDATAAASQLWGYPIAATLFLGAIVLYLASMYSYDSLLMPRRFWAEGTPETWQRGPSWIVSRPPSPAHWVLYQNMLRIWNTQFTPATVLVLMGLLVLAYSVMPFSKSCPIGSAAGVLLVAGFAALATRSRASRWMRRNFGPWLGSED